MPNFNQVVLAGHLVRDVELRYLQTGVAVANGGLAVNYNYTRESGEKVEEVTFVDFVLFGKPGETLAQYTRKGDPLLIEGRLKQENWDDKQTGAKRSKLKVSVRSFQFLTNGKDQDGQRRPARQPARNDTAQPEPQGHNNYDTDPEEDRPY